VQFHRENITWKYKEVERRDAITKKRIAIITGEIGEPKSVLDIGCGDGTFLRMIPAEEKVGIELSPESPDLEWAQLERTSFEDFRTDKKFDLVTSFHSLEHMQNCNSAFRRMVGLSSAYVSIEIPVNRHVRMHDGHIHYFTEESFVALIKKHGKLVETIRTARNIQGRSVFWLGKVK
jgi:ubiquinone/menaquinone biosynthesis C-methylase UbiE